MTLGDWRTFFANGRFVRINDSKTEFYRDPYQYGYTYNGELRLHLNYNDPYTTMPIDSPAWQAWNEAIATQSVPVASGQPILPVETVQPIVVAEEQITQAEAIAPYVPEIQEQAQTFTPVTEETISAEQLQELHKTPAWVWIAGLIAAFNILG